MNLRTLLRIIAFLETLAAARPSPAAESSGRDIWRSRAVTPADLAARQQPSWCYALASVVAAYQAVPENYKSEVFFIGATGGLSGHAAYSVCSAISPNALASARCENIGLAVGETVGLIGTGAVVYRDFPLNGNKTAVVKRHELIQAEFERYLRSRGIQFEAVETIPVVRRSEGEGGDTAGTKVVVRGFRDENGIVSDHEISLGDTNKGTSRVSFPSRSPDGTLRRREGGPAFKISYEAYQVAEGDVPDADGIITLSANLGRDWAERMQDHQDWGNYIATMDFGPAYQMSLQIIPELDSFGNEWEDPNMCGNVEG